MKRIAIAVALGALTACAGQQGGPAGMAAVDPSSPLASPMYMQMAASSDQFEIQSGQLALQMSQNPAVRQYAQMLITHHTQTSSQMIAAAQSANLQPPPPALMPNHAAMLQQLQSAPMGTFDLAFRDAQVMAHQEALTLHQNYASGGDVPALRQVAAAAVPIIQQHLTQAQSLSVSAAPPPPPPPPPPTYQQPASPGERG
jgi:putative membrane protein